MATLVGAGWVQSTQTSKALQEEPLHKPHITGGWPEEPFQYPSSCWCSQMLSPVLQDGPLWPSILASLPEPHTGKLLAGGLWEKAGLRNQTPFKFTVDWGVEQEQWNNSHKAMPDTQHPLPQGLDTGNSCESSRLLKNDREVALLWVKFVSFFHVIKWKESQTFR